MPKKKSKSPTKFVYNILIVVLSIAVLGFIYSFVKNNLSNGVVIDDPKFNNEQKELLAIDLYEANPILDIKDLRTSKRIDFIGGIRGLAELKRRVDSGEMKAAFALYPVSMQQLINIADSGNIMPPKTTWFEPKLRSGLVIHKLD